MTSSVTCPVCGADGTGVANEVIAFTLASELYRRGSGKETMMVCAVTGCLMAGIAGIVKALNMTGGFDVLLCLLGAIGAFGTALCVYFWKR
jgi:hypothetical protein